MYYTSEKNVQMLISLMKSHNIKKVIASPGTTNVALVASLQQDPFFEMYSSVDERSAAYMACGLAAESGEPVALSCTGATASRNYASGLTEAYYRKLPVLAITGAQHIGKVGQNLPQVIDRSNPMNDIAKLSVNIPSIATEDDEWAYNVMLNNALLELRHRGGGPVHVNLSTIFSPDFSCRVLPAARVINRLCYNDSFPAIGNSRIGILAGSHKKWDAGTTKSVESFCEAYNGVVFCDHTSNYLGKYRVPLSIVCRQRQYIAECRNLDILIHIGDVSGDYSDFELRPKQVWRVNPDGEIRDTFRKLRYVFEVEEGDFFKRYVELTTKRPGDMAYYREWSQESERLTAKIPELPFSNLWIAHNTLPRLPEGCILHLGILNSLRSWNFFEAPKGVLVYSNTGGFGIDGNVSSLLGASLTHPDKLYFGVVGDLAFFYDMNVLGNRHFGKNIRLIVVNNGKGTEFRNYNHHAARFGSDADAFMAAAGHYGNKSPQLIKHYAEDLGLEYLSASSKEEYIDNVDRFITSESIGRPILFEVFTDSQDESDALEIMDNLESTAKGTVMKIAKDVLSDKGVQTLKKFMKK